MIFEGSAEIEGLFIAYKGAYIRSYLQIGDSTLNYILNLLKKEVR